MSLKWPWLFFWLTGPTNQNRSIANRFNFYVFGAIWMKFGMWTANAPALLLLLPCPCIALGLLIACSQPALGLLIVCSCPASGPAHPSLAAFIIIGILRLFTARRKPHFMVTKGARMRKFFSHGEKWEKKFSQWDSQWEMRKKRNKNIYVFCISTQHKWLLVGLENISLQIFDYKTR